MKENTKTTRKEFTSLGGVRPMKIADEFTSPPIPNDTPRLIIAYALIVLVVIILIGLGIFIYNEVQKEKSYAEGINKVQSLPIQAESNPYRNVKLNKELQVDNDKLEYKQYEMQHHRPDTFKLKYYINYLPKNYQRKTINDIKEIFNSKFLYIENKKITFDYIYTIRKKDLENNEKRKVSYQNTNVNFYSYNAKNDQIPIRDFLEQCEDEKSENGEEEESYPNPLISIIVVVYKKAQNLLRTIKSIQKQSFKNIEIIIVDDNNIKLFQSHRRVIYSDPRIRVFIQKKSFGLWRKRMDGFLYSKGKYILHVDAGHILSDNLVLEDIYNICDKYDLDSVRFSFSKTDDNKKFKENKTFGNMKVYPFRHTKITYGKPKYNIKEYGYGTIWNRLVRADIFSKCLDLVDSKILNIKKDLWEDWWWNALIDRVSFSNVIANRLGYIYLYNKKTSFEPLVKNSKQKDKTIKEFIYFLYFDLVLSPEKDDKKKIIDTIKKLNQKNNKYGPIPLRLDFLKKKSPIFSALTKKLLSDPNVMFNDKMFIKELSAKIKKMLKTKKEKAKLKKKLKAKKLKLKKKNKALNDTVYNNTLAEISNEINDNFTNITEFKRQQNNFTIINNVSNLYINNSNNNTNINNMNNQIEIQENNQNNPIVNNNNRVNQINQQNHNNLLNQNQIGQNNNIQMNNNPQNNNQFIYNNYTQNNNLNGIKIQNNQIINNKIIAQNPQNKQINNNNNNSNNNQIQQQENQMNPNKDGNNNKENHRQNLRKMNINSKRIDGRK